MSSLSAESNRAAISNQGKDLRGGAKNCPAFARVCKVLWPRKTANAIASLAHVSERTAKYWLAGAHDPSARMAAIISNEIFGR